MKGFSAILIIVILSILVIVTMIFFMKYNDENAVNEKLLAVPRYDWREYIDYLKTVIDVPLKDEVQLFGFSNKINVELCLSIKTALLSGFQYQLIGPNVIDSVSKKLTHSIFSRCLIKWIAVSAIIEKMPDNVFIIVADTFDVTYQMDPRSFYEKYHQFIKKNKDYENNVIFNSELNCWPYRYDKNYRCLKHSGERFYNLYAKNSLRFFKQDNIKENPIGCQIQEKISKERKLPSNKYLNAGVSLGLVSSYRSLMLPFWQEISKSPLGCIDDQGVMGWLYGTKEGNISLDYEGKLVDHVLHQNFDFDEREGIFRNKLLKNSDDKIFNYTLLVHHSGDKSKYVTMVRSLSKWMETNKQKLVDNSTFYINGVEKKYIDVCGKFTEKDIEALDIKHNKPKH